MSFQDELDTMNADIKSTFSVSIDFVARSDDSFNTTTMKRVRTSDTHSGVSAVRGPAIVAYDNSFAEEEVEYAILVADLGVRPDQLDQIVDATITRTVTRVGMTVDRKWYQVLTRRKL